jgi:hypothetical protein
MKLEQTNSLSETEISPDYSTGMETSSGIDTGFIDEKRLLEKLPISRPTSRLAGVAYMIGRVCTARCYAAKEDARAELFEYRPITLVSAILLALPLARIIHRLENATALVSAADRQLVGNQADYRATTCCPSRPHSVGTSGAHAFADWPLWLLRAPARSWKRAITAADPSQDLIPYSGGLTVHFSPLKLHHLPDYQQDSGSLRSATLTSGAAVRFP